MEHRTNRTLVKVLTKVVHVDEVKFPDSDDKSVFEHIRQFYLLNSFQIPNIAIVEEDDLFFVKGGHKIFKIVKELQQQYANCLLLTPIDTVFVKENIRCGNLILRDLKTEQAIVKSEFPKWHWYVFYFENLLSTVEANRIIELFHTFNRNWIKSEFEQQFKYLQNGRGLAVNLFSDVPDEREWAIKFYNLAKNIHTQHKRIETINGMKLRYSLPYVE